MIRHLIYCFTEDEDLFRLKMVRKLGSLYFPPTRFARKDNNKINKLTEKSENQQNQSKDGKIGKIQKWKSATFALFLWALWPLFFAKVCVKVTFVNNCLDSNP